MSVFVSYYELVLDGDRPREQFGSGTVTSVLARRAAGPGLRIYLQEPIEPPRVRVRTGTVHLEADGIRWPETTDPHVLRGAWLRLLGVGAAAVRALHAACRREPTGLTGWLVWDGQRLHAVDEAEATLALATPMAGDEIVYLELAAPPERTMELLGLLCAPLPQPGFTESGDRE